MAILIDEIQYFATSELSALIMAMHKMQQRQLPLVLIGAGLPILSGLAGESKSYAERLLSFPDVGPLGEADTAKAIAAKVRGMTIWAFWHRHIEAHAPESNFARDQIVTNSSHHPSLPVTLSPLGAGLGALSR